MNIRLLPGARRLSSESRAGIGAALGLLAIISAVELADGSRPHFIGLFAAAPVLAAAFAAWMEVLIVGAIATVLGVLFGLQPHGMTEASAINVLGIVLASGLAAVVGTLRARQTQRVAELSRLASVAQAAVLSPLGPQVGPLAVAGRYISATAAADIGGDLYEALNTAYGVRMIIGDVREKGSTRSGWRASSWVPTVTWRTSGPIFVPSCRIWIVPLLVLLATKTS